jgi:hypothetical protein
MRVLDLIFRPKKSRRACYEEAAAVIEAFVEDRSGEWDWDDFTSTKRRDEFLESVRERCLRVYDDYPAEKEGHYCSAEGIAILRALAREIREKIPQLVGETEA